MELQKLNVKIFTEQPNRVPLTDFIDVFHGWIQATDGVYHDVADYSHMQAGPGIVLVANDAHVSIDESGNRRGLVFSQKAPLAGSNQAKLRAALRAALENCRKLEAEPALGGKLRFTVNEAVISLNDRLLGANAQESFDTIKSDVEAVAAQLFGGAALSLTRDDDPRQRLNVHIKTSAAVDLSKALANLPRD
jgi:hypothetical protein